MLPFALFRRRSLAAANAETFLVYAALAAFSVDLALFVQFLGFTPFQAGLFSVVPGAVLILAGIASGVNATLSRRGGLIAVALVGLVIAVSYDAPGTPLAKEQRGAERREESTGAFQAGMLVVAGLAFAGALVGAAGISDRDARRELREPAGAAAAET